MRLPFFKRAIRNEGTRRLAIIVPFRDSRHTAALSQGEGRTQQLEIFIDHMTTFLRDVDYHIFVVEQSQDGLPFNKGYLMNVGFNLSAPAFDYFAFHDVDQLPADVRNSYSYPPVPVHLCVTTDGRTQYSSMVGGVLLINKNDFVACNGWSNHYLGWGQEDDDMAARLRNSVGYRRAPADIGTYTSVRHPIVHGLDETYQFYKNRAYLRKWTHSLNLQDGYRDANYDTLSRERLSAKCTRYVVSIDGPSRLFGFHCWVKPAQPQGDVSLHEHVAVRSPIVSLRDCVIGRARVRLRAGGGEMVLQHIPEEREYAVFEKGSLQLRDTGPLDLSRLGGYQRQLLSSMELLRNPGHDCEEAVTTFVVERREYVNLYHTLIELFNAYVAIQLLARTEPFNILFLDGHCRGSLDTLWPDILKPSHIHRLHDYPGDAIRFRKLVLVPGGYDSPLYGTGRVKPSRFQNFLSDFVEAVLTAYQVADQPNRGRVLTFVDRRDYKPHPRSDGTVCRKVDDLAFTTGLLQRMYPLHRIDVRSFENMPFDQQLRIVRESDVLCGVHGAALAHVLFMRSDTELVEFTPREFRRNDIFENLAGLKAVRYKRYQAQTHSVLSNGKLVVRVTARPA